MPKAIFGGGVIGLLTNQDNRDQVGGYRLLAMTADLEDESQGNQEKQHKGQTKWKVWMIDLYYLYTPFGKGIYPVDLSKKT